MTLGLVSVCRGALLAWMHLAGASQIRGTVSTSISDLESAPGISLVMVSQSNDVHDSAGENTTCSEGHLLPQVYLLGAMKSATSSVAADLQASGVHAAIQPGLAAHKEFHFFGKRFPQNKVLSERQRWLSKLPACPNAQEHSTSPQFLADFTPQMQTVPLPRGWQALGNDDGRGAPAEFSLPEVLREFHGEEASRSLSFITILRDPLSRMQSAWHAAQKCQAKCICPFCRHPTFQRSLRVQMQNLKGPTPKVSDWLWASLYGRLLEQWLQSFDARQLVVMPLSIYKNNGVGPLCDALAQRGRFPLSCVGDAPTKGTHYFRNRHPSLEEDIGHQVRASFDSWIKQENVHLSEILAKAHQDGAALVGYTGPMGDSASVLSWLESNW